MVRLVLSISLAAWLVAANPDQTWRQDFWATALPVVALTELFLGIALALSLQLAFAALLTASPVEAHGAGHSHSAAPTHSEMQPAADDQTEDAAVRSIMIVASNGLGTDAPCHPGNHHGAACCTTTQCCPVSSAAVAPTSLIVQPPFATTLLPGTTSSLHETPSGPGDRPPRRIS